MSRAKLTSDLYFSFLAERLGPKRAANLRFYCSWLFDGCALPGKSALDVGAGAGLFSFYLASHGAAQVISLEPGAAGATSRSAEEFRELQQLLRLDNVRLLPITLQDFDAEGRSFDFVLLHNSINHLDEHACARLHIDEAAREAYREIFSKLYDLMAPGASLIISDSSRHNFWGMLHLRTPFTSSLEWEKHQAPRTWRLLLQSAGFTHLRTRWTSPGSLRALGRVLFGHRAGAFFFSSHFCLTLRKDV